MPSNVVIVNGKEVHVPDSWMPPLWEYLKLVEKKVNNKELEE